MWLISVTALFVGGLLGAANLVIAKQPNAKDLINKLAPYQSWIGVVLLLWGLIDLFGVVRGVGVLTIAPIWWLVYLVLALTEIGLGFLLGYGLISKYALQRQASAAAQGEKLRAALTVYQAPLGVTAMALAVMFAVVTLMR